MACIFEVYLAAVFILSAHADFLRWRHELRREFTTYLQSDDARDGNVFTVDTAVSAAMDELHRKWFGWLRAEAPPDRINHELQHYINKKRSLYGMIFNTYPYVGIQHALLFILPVLLFLISFGYLVGWTQTSPMRFSTFARSNPPPFSILSR